MTERREPTISGMKVDPEGVAKRSTNPVDSHGKTSNSRPAGNTRPSRSAPQRPVIVKSKLAPFAFFLAFISLGAAGYLYWQSIESQKQFERANIRLMALEESLKLTGSEATNSVAAIHDSLKTHFSEIDKLWAAYRKHRDGLTDTKKALAGVTKITSSMESKITNQVQKSLSSTTTEIQLINDLVDAQEAALTQIKRENSSVLTQSKSVENRIQKLEKLQLQLNNRITENEQAVKSIDAFRQSVNQEILRLKGA